MINYTSTRTILVILICFFVIIAKSQIAITEVYFNTPYNEKLWFKNGEAARRHHRGEFIEIYNYSDRDINLKNWFIVDNASKVCLPDKIIQQGQFMVVAYSLNATADQEFPSFFSSTVGKESQIIYQSNLLLRNKREQLLIGYYNEEFNTNFFAKLPKPFNWFYSRDPKSNYVKDIWTTPEKFYNTKSLQYKSDNDEPYFDTPNPLAGNKPSTKPYALLIRDNELPYYALKQYNNEIGALLNQNCITDIDAVQQTYYETNTGQNNTQICFNYDDAGHQTSATNCNGTTTTNGAYSVETINDIYNNITISPNPMYQSTQLNVSWKGIALGKIETISVYNPNNELIATRNNLINYNSYQCSIIAAPKPATYTIQIKLLNGQIISKFFIK